MKRRLDRLVPLLAGLFTLACGTPGVPPRQQFALDVRVLADDGGELAGASLSKGAQTLGSTDESGHIALTISGVEGQTTTLTLACPPGYAAAKSSVPVRLQRTRRVGGKSSEPQRIDASCLRQTRDVVLVVRAGVGGGLPLSVAGIPAGTTNPDGDGHVLLNVDRALKSLNVELDTRARVELSPKNPRKVFDLDGRDAILLFEPVLTQRRTGPAAPLAPPARRKLPTRID